METLTLMKMTKATALFGGFAILLIALIVVFAFVMWRLLLQSNVSAEERNNSNVELEAGDWLLGIVKFVGLILCFAAFCGIVSFSNAIFEILYRLLGFRNIEEIFGVFMLGIIFISFVGFGIYSVFGFIKISAEESAVKRGNK